MTSALDNALCRAGAQRPAWLKLLEQADGARRDDLAYLLAHMPQADLRGLSPELLAENVEVARRVRHETPCGMAVPEEIYRQYVLPYACLDEPRASWRPMLYETFQELARRAASISDAVLTLNRLVFDRFRVEYHPTKRPRNSMSPAESIACGYASCTGLSILLASACRAVGIPARLAGIPAWPDGSGNHTWVEVWDHGVWHFLGAAEPGPFDLTWFNDRVRALNSDRPEHHVYAIRFESGPTHFPLPWDAESRAIPAEDRTEYYRRAAPCPAHPTEILIAPRGYVCGRAPHPVRLTGRLDDPAWESAPWTDYFVDIEGHHKPTPRFHTRARLLWDDTHLYIGAVLEDPHVWATLIERNSFIFNDPDFEIFIDPDGDNHRYYEFEINPLGTIWELTLERPYRDGGPIHRGDNMPGLRSAVHVDGTLNDSSDTDHGWSVEVAIPWSGLARYAGRRPCPPRPGDQWRLNMSRVHWLTDIIGGRYRKVPRDAHPEDNWVWSPQRAVDMHRPEMWGYVQFADGLSAEAPFVPDPTWPARERLMEIYYAQKARTQPTDRVEELALRGLPDASLPDPPVLQCDTQGSWNASLRVALPGGKAGWVHVDQEGRLTVDA